jgi:hypothetical protein
VQLTHVTMVLFCCGPVVCCTATVTLLPMHCLSLIVALRGVANILLDWSLPSCFRQHAMISPAAAAAAAAVTAVPFVAGMLLSRTRGATASGSCSTCWASLIPP